MTCPSTLYIKFNKIAALLIQMDLVLIAFQCAATMFTAQQEFVLYKRVQILLFDFNHFSTGFNTCIACCLVNCHLYTHSSYMGTIIMTLHEKQNRNHCSYLYSYNTDVLNYVMHACIYVSSYVFVHLPLMHIYICFSIIILLQGYNSSSILSSTKIISQFALHQFGFSRDFLPCSLL